MFSILRIIKYGRTAVGVVDAIKAERKGETSFWGMSRDIGEAFVEAATDDGVHIMDDLYQGHGDSFNKLAESNRVEPTIGKTIRLKQLRNKRLNR